MVLGNETFLFYLNDETVCVRSFTFEVAPVFILMEEVLLKKMHSIIGWSEEEGDGIFCPGNEMITYCWCVWYHTERCDVRNFIFCYWTLVISQEVRYRTSTASCWPGITTSPKSRLKACMHYLASPCSRPHTWVCTILFYSILFYTHNLCYCWSWSISIVFYYNLLIHFIV